MRQASKGPVLHIRADLIRANAALVHSRLPGLDITGVAKVTCADPVVVRAMVEGGVAAVGDSRLENLSRLRALDLGVPLWLLRSAPPVRAGEVVQLADVSLNSEVETLRALNAAAASAGRRHRVILMIDLGDLREGIMPEELDGVLGLLRTLSSLEPVALGTNLTCYGAVVPTPQNLGELVALAEYAGSVMGSQLGVSGGNSSSLELAFAGGLPKGVTGLRVGESILLGVSTITRLPLAGLAQDAFVLEAPVIECRKKPTLPRGEIAQDAFGRRPLFVDRGTRLRAICALGRQDCVPEGLQPLDPGVEVLGASSDHLILDVEDMPRPPRVGDTLRFLLNYGALLAAATSPYVRTVYHEGPL